MNVAGDLSGLDPNGNVWFYKQAIDSWTMDPTWPDPDEPTWRFVHLSMSTNNVSPRRGVNPFGDVLIFSYN